MCLPFRMKGYMQDIFEFADDLGPLKIVHIYDPKCDLKAVVAIDNVARGPSIGGIRMAPDVSAEEAFRLARAMTLKNSAANLPHGGGKSVIFGDPRMDLAKKEQLVRAFARAIRDLVEYIPGPDMGTDERCMAWIKDEIGRAVGLPPEIGGIPLDEIGATGLGLKASVEAALKYCDFALEGARVVIQGFGSVGKHAARFLGEKGTVLVAASDSRGTIFNPKGIDVARLIALKDSGKGVTDYSDGQKFDADAVIDIECEIWIPAARPDVIRNASCTKPAGWCCRTSSPMPAVSSAPRWNTMAARNHRRCKPSQKRFTPTLQRCSPMRRKTAHCRAKPRWL
ncbi:MAG: glutamate dehydrogenase [Deltaproteobacteria bacterium]|nr:glutamate dehydrogenase [Deltaproteobacteria bacterium]